jgi:hypothetical protein
MVALDKTPCSYIEAGGCEMQCSDLGYWEVVRACVVLLCLDPCCMSC